MNFQIYGEFGECLSDSLDNPLEDDFNEGLKSTFDGESLGECRGFDIGTDNMGWDSSMVLLHDGN